MTSFNREESYFNYLLEIKTMFKKGEDRFEGRRKTVEFTLIELLVVIAIIGILAGMLMPALNRARTAAYKVGGVSNARQIATALHMYADHFGSMPFHQEADWQESNTRWYRSRRRYWSNRLMKEGFIPTAAIFWGPGRDWGKAEGWPNPASWEYNQGGWGGIGGSGGYFEQTGFGLSDGVSDSEEGYRSRLQPDGPGTPKTGVEWDGYGRGKPLRLGEANSPYPAMHVMLTDVFNSRCFAVNDTKYFYGNRTGHLGQITRYDGGANGLYNFDGGVVRAYVDGRAHAGGNNWTDESSTLEPDPDELAWDLESINGIFVPSDDPRGGAPVYTSTWQYWRVPPYWCGWRAEWGTVHSSLTGYVYNGYDPG